MPRVYTRGGTNAGRLVSMVAACNARLRLTLCVVTRLRVWLYDSAEMVARDLPSLKHALARSAALATTESFAGATARRFLSDFDLWSPLGTSSDGRVLLPPRLIPCMLTLFVTIRDFPWELIVTWAQTMWVRPRGPEGPSQLPTSVWATGDASRVMAQPCGPEQVTLRHLEEDTAVLRRGFMGDLLLIKIVPELGRLSPAVRALTPLSPSVAQRLYHCWCMWAQVWITFEAQLRCPSANQETGPAPYRLSELATMRTRSELRRLDSAYYGNVSLGNSRVMSMQLHHLLSTDPVHYTDIQGLDTEDTEQMPLKAREIEEKRRHRKRQRREKQRKSEPASPSPSTPVPGEVRGLFDVGLGLDLDLNEISPSEPSYPRPPPASSMPRADPRPRPPVPSSAPQRGTSANGRRFTYTDYMRQHTPGEE